VERFRNNYYSLSSNANNGIELRQVVVISGSVGSGNFGSGFRFRKSPTFRESEGEQSWAGFGQLMTAAGSVIFGGNLGFAREVKRS